MEQTNKVTAILGNSTPALHEMARKYADHNFDMQGQGAIKHDIAFHAYCDGFNAALRTLMEMRNLVDPCANGCCDPNFSEMEQMTKEHA